MYPPLFQACHSLGLVNMGKNCGWTEWWKAGASPTMVFFVTGSIPLTWTLAWFRIIEIIKDPILVLISAGQALVVLGIFEHLMLSLQQLFGSQFQLEGITNIDTGSGSSHTFRDTTGRIQLQQLQDRDGDSFLSIQYQQVVC
ncbi:hypothetical protein WICPIJ_008882 [Wickerhamomyces pijperi]|uniref:Uncharacterized protein n=1 Tax=Wickerhamomyces pijperi TaxID=599730 RepID=A0A9P8PU86_WICPI|nr:hypothetical protein WICPIJ_008882 [Wickerhamomyces pijperi]